ncbi:MAG TPA: AIM24 family protein, partial [Thermoanaerobacterales bacterium]|nr:AIM24 family protein [Thermoanaerobacterales bacterium]
FPGKIVPIHLQAGESIICQKSAFLCAEHSVKLATHLKKKLGAGFFGGEGFILQKVTGPGWCFLEIDGEAVEYQLGSGEKMKVDTGHVAVFESSVNYDIEMVKGFRNILFGGEGLFLTTLQGPGKVWLQSMPINNLAARIIPYIPSSNE